MKKRKTHLVELGTDEYATLIGNRMIMSACDDMLASPRRSSGYVVLRLTQGQLEDLTGWVAAEANHTKNRDEEEALSDVWQQLESVLTNIGLARSRSVEL